MTTRLIAALLLLQCGGFAYADTLNRPRVMEHVRKKFSTPKGLKMSIGQMTPSPLPGYMTGKITFGEGDKKSERDIHISHDGRYYILAPVYKTKKADFPGLLVPIAAKGQAPPPPVYLTPDGKYLFLGNGISAPQDATVDPDQFNRKLISLKNVNSRGPINAPVTVVEYSDLQCPYCKIAHDILSKKLQKTFGKKVRWVFKHYPLKRMHPWAYDAAIAAACAGRQNTKGFRAVQDALFHNQKSINKKNLREKALGFAKTAGLKTAPFTRCIDKKETASLVDKDIREGDRLGVQGTPTIFINGRKLGHFDFSVLSDIVEEMLAKKNSR